MNQGKIQTWEDFKAFAMESGFTEKVPGRYAFRNLETKQMLILKKLQPFQALITGPGGRSKIKSEVDDP